MPKGVEHMNLRAVVSTQTARENRCDAEKALSTPPPRSSLTTRKRGVRTAVMPKGVEHEGREEGEPQSRLP